MAVPMVPNVNWRSIERAMQALNGLGGGAGGFPGGQIGAGAGFPPHGMPWGAGGIAGAGAGAGLPAGGFPWPVGGAAGGAAGGMPWAIGGAGLGGAGGAGGIPWNPQPAAQGQPAAWNPQPAANAGENGEEVIDGGHYTTVAFTPDERPMRCIYDSGAPVSLMSEANLQRYYGAYNLPRRRLPRPMPLGGMGGFSTHLHEYVSLPIKLKAEQDFGYVELRGSVVLIPKDDPGLPQIILGMQFLRENKLMMHWGEGYRDDWIEWNGLKLPRQDQQAFGLIAPDGSPVNMAMDMQQLQQYLDQIARMSQERGPMAGPGLGPYGGQPQGFPWPPGGGANAGGLPQGIPWPPGGGGPPQGFPWPAGGMAGGMPWAPQAAGAGQPHAWNPQPAGQNDQYDDDGVPPVDLNEQHFSTKIWTLNDEALQVVFDTGAGVSVISEERLQRSFPGLPRVRLGRPFALSGFGGHDQMCHEAATITFKLKAEGDYGFIECKAFVVIMAKRTCTELLLGLHFLRENRLTMHWGNNRSEDWLEWGGLKIPRIVGARPL